MTATLLTCSFRGDLDVCRLLCRSVDLYASSDFEHLLYVPRRDLPLFANLASPRRRVEPQEGLLPSWFFKAPLPGPEWRKRLRLPRRNLYLTPFHGPVRGWIAQQIMKISASLRAETEIVVHLDSDAALVRPLWLEELCPGGRARLFAGPLAQRQADHAPWYAAGARLLGLGADDCYNAEYIAPLIVWRRSVVEAMTARIEATTGRSWASALAGTKHFSEYVLYGLFAERGLGLEAAGLKRESRSLCLARWTGAFADPSEIDSFLAAIEPDQLVCCLQSTIDIPLRTRARIFKDAARVVEAQRPRPAREAAA
jgi:hypothetical protein